MAAVNGRARERGAARTPARGTRAAAVPAGANELDVAPEPAGAPARQVHDVHVALARVEAELRALRRSHDRLTRAVEVAMARAAAGAPGPAAAAGPGEAEEPDEVALTSDDPARRRRAYAGLVGRARALLAAEVPAGAAVLVASKGDPALVELDGPEGWHFLQDGAGRYAGHHPGDGRSAVEELDRLRRRGASHFFLPATASWWLGHYPELARHLEVESTSVRREPGTGTLFHLVAVGALTRPRDPGGGAGLTAGEALVDLIESLLPMDASVLVAAHRIGRPARLCRYDVRARTLDPLTEVDPSRDDDPLLRLESLRRQGAEYLVVPLEGSDGAGRVLARRAGERYPRVAHHVRIGGIYDLTRPLPGAGPADRE